MGQAESVPNTTRQAPARNSRPAMAALEEKFDSFRVRDEEADGVLVKREGMSVGSAPCTSYTNNTV